MLTPKFCAAMALQCCSYCPFNGITIIFFSRKSASAGSSKPAPQRTPVEFVKLLLKQVLSIGKK